jgi:hypothetical protein
MSLENLLKTRQLEPHETKCGVLLRPGYGYRQCEGVYSGG